MTIVLVVQRASTSGKGKNSQSEITLKDELDQRDRLDIYRNFLLYCMSGNIVSLPMGTSSAPLASPTYPLVGSHLQFTLASFAPTTLQDCGRSLG